MVERITHLVRVDPCWQEGPR